MPRFTHIHLSLKRFSIKAQSLKLQFLQEVKKRLSSDAAASANRGGRWKDQTRRAAHNGCGRRVSQTRALFYALWKLLESEELVEPLMTTEIGLVRNLSYIK